MYTGLVAAVIVCLMSAAIAFAGHGEPRGTTASLSGRVVDASGAPLAGVALTLRGPDPSLQERSFRSDRHGRYEVANLTPGRYRLKAGYRNQTPDEREITLYPGEAQRLDIRLDQSPG